MDYESPVKVWRISLLIILGGSILWAAFSLNKRDITDAIISSLESVTNSAIMVDDVQVELGRSVKFVVRGLDIQAESAIGRADALYGSIKMWPLWFGKIHFEELSATNPHLDLTRLDPRVQTERSEVVIPIDNIAVVGGSLTVKDFDGRSRQFSKINININQLTPGKVGDLALSFTEADRATSLDGTITLPDYMGYGSRCRSVTLDVAADNLPLDVIPPPVLPSPSIVDFGSYSGKLFWGCSEGKEYHLAIEGDLEGTGIIDDRLPGGRTDVQKVKGSFDWFDYNNRFRADQFSLTTSLGEWSGHGDWDGERASVKGTLEVNKDGLKLAPLPHTASLPEKISMDVFGGWSANSYMVDFKGDLFGGRIETGLFKSSDSNDISFNGKFINFDIAKTAAALLGSVPLRGSGPITAELTGVVRDEVVDWHSTVKFSDSMLKLGENGPELEKLNGTIWIDEAGIKTHDLKFVDDGTIKLKIPWQGDSEFCVYANDFSAKAFGKNPNSTISKIGGCATIGSQAVTLNDIRVELPETNVTVSGEIGLVDDIESILTIRGAAGNVTEVIQLFTVPSPSVKRNGKSKPLYIDIAVDKGSFGKTLFYKGQGKLSITDKELSVRDIKAGFYGGNIVMDVVGEGAPGERHYRITGKATNANASQLVTAIGAKAGTVRGTMTADFDLYSEHPTHYMSGAYGTMKVFIKDGLFEKYKNLANTLSVLNLGQIFDGDGFDISDDGLPFEKVWGDLVLKEGVMSSNNLQMKSSAADANVIGTFDFEDHGLDVTVGVKPIKLVDDIIPKIPIAGWILAGEEKALVTVYVKATGLWPDIEVEAVPLDTLTKTATGVFKRIFQFPETLITDPAKLFGQ